MVAPDSEDNVTAFEGAAETGGAGAYRKAVHIQVQGNRFAFDEVEGDISILRQPPGAVSDLISGVMAATIVIGVVAVGVLGVVCVRISKVRG